MLTFIIAPVHVYHVSFVCIYLCVYACITYTYSCGYVHMCLWVHIHMCGQRSVLGVYLSHSPHHCFWDRDYHKTWSALLQHGGLTNEPQGSFCFFCLPRPGVADVYNFAQKSCEWWFNKLRACFQGMRTRVLLSLYRQQSHPPESLTAFSMVYIQL